MDKIKEIISLVFVAVGIIAYIITTVLAIKRKKADGEKINAEEVLASIATNVLELVGAAESMFPQGGGGSEKLKTVLAATKSMCKEAGIIFDRSYWVDYVEKAVKLINISKQSETSASENKETVSNDDTPLE